MIVLCIVVECPWKIKCCSIGSSNVVQVHTFWNFYNHSLEDAASFQPLVKSTRASLVIDHVIWSTPEYQPR